MRFLSLCSCVFVIFACEAAMQTPGVSDSVRDLDENFTYGSLALSPSTATSQGYHRHHGVNLDQQLDDYSPSAMARARAFYQSSLDSLNRLSGSRLSEEDAADIQIIRAGCNLALLDFDHIQAYRHNPTVYVETLGNALFSPLILNYAPEEQRMSDLTARVERIPVFLDQAKSNLKDAPEIWNRVARDENQGNYELIDHEIRSKIPASLRARYDQAAAVALAALHRFDDFLANDLIKRQSDWRLGSKLYAEKFKYTIVTDDTPDRVLADADTKLRDIREEMGREAAAVYPKYFGNAPPPADMNVVISQVLDKIATQHTTPQHYFDEAERDLDATTRFVEHHGFVSVPKPNNLKVIPTPEFQRGIYAVGGFSAAPALEPKLGSFYWITPFTPDMSAERVESKLREYNRYGLEILTIHEAMPGHYLQFEYADRVSPIWRRTLRLIYSNGPYVEGWAVYATELMVKEGFDDTPEMRLTFGKQMLRAVANTVLDVRLQTMNMTDQQALDLMIKDTFQEKEEATAKLRRAKLSSCQLPMYFVGWRDWDRLREAYQKKMGDHFDQKEFHERALNEGAVPMPVLDRLLLQ